MLSSRFNRWNVKFPEPVVNAAKRKPSVFNKKFLKHKKSWTRQKKLSRSLQSQTNSLKMSAAILSELSTR